MNSGASSRSEVHLGTVVTIESADSPGARESVERAFQWFREIESRCSRFDPSSELRRLSGQIGVPVRVSDLLFEAVRFAVETATQTHGAFDPSIGHVMASRGFDREHRSGERVEALIDADAEASYRDIVCDPQEQTITLARPLVLDLGGVVKGLAIDLAARELEPCVNFAIDAGGDLYLGGAKPSGAPWTVGIRHPRIDGALIDVLVASNQAVCTSGDYERHAGGGHHILDPRTKRPAEGVASVTVVAPSAMLADAVATAAFVLGPDEGLAWCDDLGVDALFITPDLTRHETPGLRRQ